MSMNENRLLHSEFIKYERNSRDTNSFNEYKMSKLSVRLAVWIAVSSSAFFGLSQVTGASGAPNNGFELYWNVPTFMCHQYGMFFEEVSDFGIRQNRKDQFRGDEIAILYDPGVFPALLKDEYGHTKQRNGGVPQEGNLTHHLDLFQRDVNEQIADVDFAGLAVIDFESWRPIFRQNWASLSPYRDLSTEIEKAKHPSWDKNRVNQEATRRFEKAGRLFVESTLRHARTLRPKASWGYYAYPYCFNMSPGAPSAGCDPKVFAENDRLSWMFGLQDVILPSVYLRAGLTKTQRIGLISGRVKEAIRMSKNPKPSPNKPVLAYFWYKYQDKRASFLESDDVVNGLKTIKNVGGSGAVIWGSSDDVNTKLKCQQLKDYLAETLGPVAWKFKVGRSESLNITTEEYDSTTAVATETTSVTVKDDEQSANYYVFQE